MRFDVLTIFPDAFEGLLGASLLGKAIADGRLAVGLHDLRSFTDDPHRKVDDEPFGGGAGMVMRAQPIVDAVQAVRTPGSRVLLMSASGRPFDQKMAASLAEAEHVVIICGRYEGVDARVETLAGAEPVSMGPFVLSGGEVAAMAVIDAVARLVPGVMGNQASLAEESYTSPLLEYPQYTRPAELAGAPVPEVLLSGDHARIAAWRRRQSLLRTFKMKPELLEQADLTPAEREEVERWREQGPPD